MHSVMIGAAVTNHQVCTPTIVSAVFLVWQMGGKLDLLQKGTCPHCHCQLLKIIMHSVVMGAAVTNHQVCMPMILSAVFLVW